MAQPAIPTSRPRVLSGMRPTGKLHLGNYMGALANWVRLQDSGQYDCYFFIADWHALTTDYADPSQIKLRTVDMALDWLAAGIDPQRSTVFIQSHVPQHAELHLLFSMITPVGWLQRVPTYKDQIENITDKDLATYGFLGYPLLQAADILVYQATFIPVGQDQVAHVELTREVARRFNSMYGVSVFPEPEALLTPSPKLLGTDGRKMSKSYGNTIGVAEAPAVVAAKVLATSTNGQRIRQTDPGDPDLCPIGDLHKSFSPSEVVASTSHGCRTATIRCETCKIEAADSVCAVTTPIHEKRMRLEDRVEDTWDMLRDQAAKASARAEETMRQVRPVFALSHDLGGVRRHFFHSEEAIERLHDLTSYSGSWDLPHDLQSKLLRSYWKANLSPRDVELKQERNRKFATLDRELEEPFIGTRGKRILVTSARQEPSGWDFRIPPRSYEAWVLLCWQTNYRLEDIVLPQKCYAQPFAEAKRAAKNQPIHVRIWKAEDRWNLEFVDLLAREEVGHADRVPAGEPLDVTNLIGNYDPLR